MIVPRNRLLVWFAVVALPFSILGAVLPSTLAISCMLIGALIAMLIIDAWRVHGSLSSLKVTSSPVLRLALDQEAKIELRIHQEIGQMKSLRLALPMSPAFASLQESLFINLAQESEWSQVYWRCRGLKRGNYTLESVYVETSSPLGFWDLRRRLPLAAEVRVYPNLLNESKNLALLLLNRGTFGVHTQRQIGKGRDFEKLRDYVPGDGYEDIHWKATAKKGHPVSKVYQLERTQEIYVVVDASRLSARQSTIERFVTSSLVLGLAAEQQGDLFGLLAFSNKVETFVRARNGKAHYNACRDAIYTLEARPLNPDFDEVFSFIRSRLRRRALIIFLTCLDDPLLAESFVRSVSLISRQHLVLVCMPQPSGIEPLFSHSKVDETEDIYTNLAGHIRWQGLQELGKTLERQGVGFSLLEEERLSSQLISQYLNVKKRQLL